MMKSSVTPHTAVGRFGRGGAVASLLAALLLMLPAYGDAPAAKQDAGAAPPPVKLTAQEDHQRIMDLLKIASLRRGADGNNRQSPYYANYDEAKANPYPDLPDPL